MKTIKEINQEISDIKHRIETEQMKKPVESKLRKRVKYLRTCILYLETNPSHLFLRNEVARVENIISLRMGGFITDDYVMMAKPTVTKMKKEYEKQFDIPKLREQVRTMRFLLK